MYYLCTYDLCHMIVADSIVMQKHCESLCIEYFLEEGRWQLLCWSTTAARAIPTGLIVISQFITFTTSWFHAAGYCVWQCVVWLQIAQSQKWRYGFLIFVERNAVSCIQSKCVLFIFWSHANLWLVILCSLRVTLVIRTFDEYILTVVWTGWTTPENL